MASFELPGVRQQKVSPLRPQTLCAEWREKTKRKKEKKRKKKM
jgi:hypothetical protein